MEQIPAKSILSGYSENGWFASNYTMNLYRGCCHGCIYCDSRSTCYGIEEFERVRKKENALVLLERELRAKRRRGVVLTGSMSDPYNPFEKQEQIIYGALRLMARYGFGVVVLTKSDLVMRDAALFQAIRRCAPAVVNVTVTCGTDELCRKIEPYAPVTSRRMEAVRQLTQQGIICGILMTPLLPFLNDTEENITLIVKQAAQAGAKWIYAERGFAVSLRDRQKVYFYDRLDELSPGMRDSYQQAYGGAYWCPSPKSGLWEHFMSQCDRMGLLWEHKKIDEAIQAPYEKRQISLFEE